MYAHTVVCVRTSNELTSLGTSLNQLSALEADSISISRKELKKWKRSLLEVEMKMELTFE